MKSNRGMTIISLLIYIIVLSALIGSVSILIRYFYRNSNELIVSSKTSEQYTRFITYLTDDINSKKIDKDNMEVNSIKIDFGLTDSTTHKYLYEQGKLFYIVLDKDGNLNKKITLCDELDSCNFVHNATSGKLTVSLTINGITYNNNFNI